MCESLWQWTHGVYVCLKAISFAGNNITDILLQMQFLLSASIILIIASFEMMTSKQEYFIKEYLPDFNVNIVMGLVEVLMCLPDFKETPIRWRKGFEWIYRLAQAPFNFDYWKRYFITNPWFLYQVYKNKLLKGVTK